MPDHYRVTMRKAVHVFSAGHFITLTDEICEPMHGHNWTVACEVFGCPDAHGMVVDFLPMSAACYHLQTPPLSGWAAGSARSC
jgi:6-pyruvoyl-tetrahydropterin synthase